MRDLFWDSSPYAHKAPLAVWGALSLFACDNTNKKTTSARVLHVEALDWWGYRAKPPLASFLLDDRIAVPVSHHFAKKQP